MQIQDRKAQNLSKDKEYNGVEGDKGSWFA